MKFLLALSALLALAACDAMTVPSVPPTASASPVSSAPTTRPTESPSTSPSGPAQSAIVWPQPAQLPLSQSIQDIVAWQGTYVAGGEIIGGTDSQAGAWTSSDGRSWRQVMAEGNPGERGRVANLLVTDAGLIGVGWVGTEQCPDGGEGATACDSPPMVTWTTNDGQTWARHDLGETFAGAQFAAVATDGHELVAVGRSAERVAQIWHSTDGVTWTPEVLDTAFDQANLKDVAWTDSTWLVAGSIGVESQGSGGVIEPPDTTGAIWQGGSGSWARADFGNLTWSVYGLYAAGHGVVAAAEVPGSFKAATFWQSTDGTDWSSLPDGTPHPVATDGASIIGDNFAAGDAIAYSITTDGLLWQPLEDMGALDARPHWENLPQADDHFLVGDRLFVTSTAGLLWPAQLTRP